MRPLGWGFAGLVLGLACASYDPGADYRSRLEPLADAPAVRPLGARDFAVPPPLAEAPVPEAGGTVAARAEALMAWLGGRVTFDGSAVPPFPLTAPNLWAAAGRGAALNCLAASVLFASLAEASGMRCRVLSLYPRDLSDENHVVVLVWEPGEGRWLVADPSYRTLFHDAAGRALGPGELRSLVAGGGDPVLSAGASWNGQPVEPGYVHYLSKNLYRWSVPGSDGRRIVLAPAGRPVFEPPWGFTVQASGVREFLAPP